MSLVLEQEQREKNSPETAETPAFKADITPSQNEEAEKELQRNIQKSDFKDMQIIGQVSILSELDISGMEFPLSHSSRFLPPVNSLKQSKRTSKLD